MISFKQICTFMVLVLVHGRVLVECTCTKRSLKRLDLDSCFTEISTQYPWNKPNGTTLDASACFPKNIFFLHDISSTVLTTEKGGERDMMTLQRTYINLFTNFFESNDDFVSNFANKSSDGYPIYDTLHVIPYASTAMEVLQANYFEGDISEFTENLNDLVPWIRKHPVQNTFLFGKNRGWSRPSKALNYVSNELSKVEILLSAVVEKTSKDDEPTVLEDEENQLKIFNTTFDLSFLRDHYQPVIILMTDGKPESALGYKDELKKTIRAARNLKKKHGAHIHCVVLSHNKFSQSFWKRNNMCDSKQIFSNLELLDSYGADKVMQNGMELMSLRKNFCQDYFINFPPTSSPSKHPTNSPTPSPSTSPTISPSVSPTSLPTASPLTPCGLHEKELENLSELDIANNNVLVNNLGGFCGLHTTSGVDCGSGIEQTIELSNITTLNGKSVNMIIRNTTEYKVVQRNEQLAALNQFNNGKSGNIGQIAMQKDSNVTLEVSFVDYTGSSVWVPVLDFSIFDIDQKACTCTDCNCTNCENREVIKIDEQQFRNNGENTELLIFHDYATSLCQEKENDSVIFKSTLEGTVGDNPGDPHVLTEFQKQISLKLRLFNVSKFSFTFEIEKGDPTGGRQLLFSGSSAVSPCESLP